MDMIFQNREILCHILSYVVKKNISCVAVCKLWSELALDIIWHRLRMADFYHVLKRLAPMVGPAKYVYIAPVQKPVRYGFGRNPTVSDWDQFRKYSRRVRVLDMKPSQPTKLLQESVYNSLAMWCPPGGIFPNLTELIVDTRRSFYVPLFLVPGLKTLRVGLHYPKNEGEPENVGNNRLDVLVRISSKITALHEISIYMVPYPIPVVNWDSSYTVYEEEGLLCQLLRQQNGLRVLSLPWFWFTTRIAEAVAFLPDLERIRIVKMEQWRFGMTGNPLDTLIFNPTFSPGTLGGRPFSALQELCLAVPYPQFRRFLLNWIPPEDISNPSVLRVLTMHSQVLESPQTMQSLLDILVPRCPKLTSLTLLSLSLSSQMPSTETRPYQAYYDSSSRARPSEWSLLALDPFRITLDTIKSLFSLKHLDSLELRHHLPAAFSPSDLEVIASGFSHLRILYLFPDSHPIFVEPSKTAGSMEIPLESGRYDEIIRNPVEFEVKRILELGYTLRTFGTRCPKLEKLSVFVCPEWTDTTDEYSSEDTANNAQLFPVLKELLFGSSPFWSGMNDMGLLTPASILSSYLQPGVQISIITPWDYDHDLEEKDPEDYHDEPHFDDYLYRLSLGGKVVSPEAALATDSVGGLTQDTTTSNSIDVVYQPPPTESASEQPTPNAFNIWTFDVKANLIPSDQAILTSVTRDPLVFNISEFLEDAAMRGTLGGLIEIQDGFREKWMPGVALTGKISDGTAVELDSRRRIWKDLAEMVPLMMVIKRQERRLMERQLGMVES